MAGNLFYSVAIDAPSVSDKISDCIEAIKDEVPRASWTAKGKFHITLQFLGDVPEAAAVERLMRLQPLGPGHVRIKEAGYFVNARGPRVLFLKLHDNGFLDQISYELGRRGLFNAHLTLAKLEDKGDGEPKLYELARQINDIDFGSQFVSSVHLCKTVGRDMPYQVVASQSLQGRLYTQTF